LSSVFAKLFEYVFLERLRPVLAESNCPHFLQSAYQKGISCEDAIFATQEASLRLLREGGSPFLSFFNLEKAFDTIEKPILLKCLYNAGVRGRAWRLIDSWYTNTSAAVEIDGSASHKFILGRGVRQGSVLSPTLFLIVMDEMLRVMTTMNSGVSIAGLYLGTAAHADDVRSLSQTVAAAENQASTLAEFTINRGLKINANKTEIVALSRGHHTPLHHCWHT